MDDTAPQDSPYQKELDRLWQAAESVREQMEQQTMTPDAALASLRTVQARDADGYTWRMEVDGNTGQLSLYRYMEGMAAEGPFYNASAFALVPSDGLSAVPPPATDPLQTTMVHDMGVAKEVPIPTDGIPDEPEETFFSQTWVKIAIAAVIVAGLIWVLFLRGGDDPQEEGQTASSQPSAAPNDPNNPQEPPPVQAVPVSADRAVPIQDIMQDGVTRAPEGFLRAWEGFINAAANGNYDDARQWLSAEAVSDKTRAEIYEIAVQWAGPFAMDMAAYTTPPYMKAPTIIQVSVYFDPDPTSQDNDAQAIAARSLCAVLQFVSPANDDTWRLEEWPLLDSGPPCAQG